MIRPAGKNDCFFIVLFSKSQGFLSFVFHIPFETLLLLPCRMDSVTDFFFRDSFCLKNLIHPLNQTLVIIIRNERMRKFHAVLLENIVHIIGNDLRIGCDNRTVVMVLRAFILYLFIVYARIEYPLFSHFHQCLYVPMHKLRRVAGSIRGNRVHPLFIQFLRRHRRKYHAVRKLRKESKPKRIVLVHIQNTRKRNAASLCFLCRKRLISK